MLGREDAAAIKAVHHRPKKCIHRVRCLGPGPEHTFLSSDRVRNRVCLRCRTNMLTISQTREYHVQLGD